MRIKKLISCSLVVLLGFMTIITGFFDNCIADAQDQEIDYSQIFNMSETDTEYRILGFKKDYKTYLQGLSTTELVYPEKYGTPEKSVTGNAMYEGNLDELDIYENYITSIRFNSSYSNVSAYGLSTYNKLEKVEFRSKNLTLGDSIAYDTQMYTDLKDLLGENDANSIIDYAKIKEIYINADSVTVDQNAFNKINASVKITVTSQAVKDAIVTATKDGSAPISKDQITVNDTKQPSEFEIECENPVIYFGTEGGFKLKAKINIGDQKQEDVTYTLYKDSAGETEISFGYYQSNIPVGKYYVGASMRSTDNYHASVAKNNMFEVEVKEHEEANKTALKAAITDAEEFYSANQYKQENYQTNDWNKVFGRSEALEKAKEIDADTEKGFSQAQVDEATKNLTDALATLKNSKADNSAAWKELQDEIAKAEAFLAKKDEYTEDSWNRVNPQSRIDAAKALKKDEATIAQIQNQISVLKNIATGLELKQKEPEVKPGDPFAFIPKKGAEVKVLSMTAPESLAGATKVRVTFKCADDTSFNENASIDLNPIIAGTDNYLQIKGTGDYTTGAIYTVEVPLSAAIKAGDSIELRMATYSWEGAKDWVYGVTAIEFVGADDKVLGSYIDKDVFKANLASAITEAEAINTSTYTAESVKKLTDAIAAAKALTADATPAEMSKAIDAINDAIKGLQKKDDDTDAAKEKLTTALKEAEAIDSSLYTPESYDKLKKALDAAKALKDDATPEEIEKAAQAINEAIKGLVKKDGSGDPQNPGDPKNEPKVIGVAKGKTFKAGNFNYKVSVAATITGTVKTAGKVTVVGLSAAGKKKSSVSIKNTVSASGASYQVTGIGSKVFQKSTKVKKVTLGSNVKSIPASAFAGCKKLTTVKATGVTKIGSKAFKGCKVLKKLTFGKKKLTSVKKGAFKGCKKKIKVAGGSKKVKKGNLKKLKKSGYKKFK